ncbi:MobC family replication-relaxation protein [Aliivibrio sp. SR45-2]|uniref:MobC family replication-relaxation protein n=1 Tax=Aliivibrio sp. SR45-2 TaxID=2760931 RepID=UPI0015F7BA9D|nr:MobC family replication-relaxation protein [Aliivibrio sp. SR45-2]MBB1313379.1 mobilization protein [Aliivibrio sp. SR45-2]
MIISDPKKRTSRNAEKFTQVLTFLKQETYSDFTNLMLLLSYKNRAPLDRLLRKMKKHGFIEKFEYGFRDIQVKVWGITGEGMTEAVESGDTEDFQHFEPSKIKTWTMVHHLMNQEVRIYLERKGWTNWQNADRYSFRKKYPVPHRPDALIVAPNGHTIAIETERTLKTKPRYQEIIKSHLLAKKDDYWIKVIYVVPDIKTKIALTNRFNNITYVNMNGSRITLTDEHRSTFHIFTLDEMKTLVIT